MCFLKTVILQGIANWQSLFILTMEYYLWERTFY